jgi:hypothetical protein
MLTLPMEREAGWVTEVALKVWKRDKFILSTRIGIANRPAQQPVGSASNTDTREDQSAALTKY